MTLSPYDYCDGRFATTTCITAGCDGRATNHNNGLCERCAANPWRLEAPPCPECGRPEGCVKYRPGGTQWRCTACHLDFEVKEEEEVSA